MNDDSEEIIFVMDEDGEYIPSWKVVDSVTTEYVAEWNETTIDRNYITKITVSYS